MADIAGIMEREQDRTLKASESRSQMANQTTQAINTSARTGLAVQKSRAEAQGRVDVMASSWLSTLGQLDQKKGAAKRAVENAPDGEAKTQALNNLAVATDARNNFMMTSTGNGAVMSMLKGSSFIDNDMAKRIFDEDTISDMSQEMKDQYAINLTAFHRAGLAEEGRKSVRLTAQEKIIGAAQGRKAALDAGLPLTAADGDPEERARLRAKGGVVGAGEGREELKGRGLSLSASAGKRDLGRYEPAETWFFTEGFGASFKGAWKSAAADFDFGSAEGAAETERFEQLAKDLTAPTANAGWSYNLIQDAINGNDYSVGSPFIQALKSFSAIYEENMPKAKDIDADTGKARERKQTDSDRKMIRNLKQSFLRGEKKTLQTRGME